MKPLLLIAILLVPPGPTPSPATTTCTRVEPVFGVTAAGAVVEQRFCVRNAHSEFLPSRPVVEPPVDLARQFFWGGMLDDNASVIYSLTPDGDLWWARQDAATGLLGAPVAVGRGFGNWSRYRQIMANGRGEIFAQDSTGHLLRWVHIGWRVGEDSWEPGPQDLGRGCRLGTPVFASTFGPPLRYVAPQDDPPSYAFCTTEGEVQIASRLPAVVRPGSATMAVAPGVAFALFDAGGELTRMVLDAGSGEWQPANRTGASYRTAFSGWAFMPGEDPPVYRYEWQWTFYQGNTPGNTQGNVA